MSTGGWTSDLVRILRALNAGGEPDVGEPVLVDPLHFEEAVTFDDNITVLGNNIAVLNAADLLQNHLPLLHVCEEQASGINGHAGATFTFGAYRTRVLNTVKTNEITGASLSSNQVILPAGIYWAVWEAPAIQVNAHKTKFYNFSDSSDVGIGSSKQTAPADLVTTHSSGYTRFTTAAQKTFEVRHRCQSTKTLTGFGFASGFGDVEVYTDLKIWKVG